ADRGSLLGGVQVKEAVMPPHEIFYYVDSKGNVTPTTAQNAVIGDWVTVQHSPGSTYSGETYAVQGGVNKCPILYGQPTMDGMQINHVYTITNPTGDGVYSISTAEGAGGHVMGSAGELRVGSSSSPGKKA